jgi:hypothetical protein
MALLKQALAAIGIGGANVRLQVPNAVIPRGGTVRGTVCVRGGSVPQRLKALTITLTENGLSNTTRVLAAERRIGARSVFEVPFVIRIPDSARMSSAGARWSLQTVALLAWSALYPIDSVTLEVGYSDAEIRAQREIVAVKDAFQALGFQETPWPLHHLFQPGDETTACQDYDVPSWLREALSRVAISLRAEGDFLIGKMVVHRQQAGPAGYLPGTIGGHGRAFPVQIRRANLLTSHGEPRKEGALPILQAVLDQALRLSDRQRDQLLRPSSAPESGQEDLLRPAGYAAPDPDASLLRPWEADDP